MTAAYEVWTGTEQVHEEQLSIFSSNTRTGEHHMKVLGRGMSKKRVTYSTKYSYCPGHIAEDQLKWEYLHKTTDENPHGTQSHFS